ncbi:MAG: Sec-dependent nitrous-oxide reductase, partial [bacterium]
MRTKIFLWIGLTLVIGIIIGIGCGGEKKTGRAGVRSDVQEAAIKSYVAPGDLDEYYIFKSGGHSGQVYVYGIPSMRHIATIPVFTPYPATGYGFD